MTIRHIIVTAFISILLTVLIHAQSPTPMRGMIAAKAKSTEKGVKLRFAPDSYSTWMAMNETGWTIERIAFTENGQLIPPSSRTSEIISSSIIRPSTQADWQANFSDDYVVVAAQALYGESFVTTKGGISDYIELNNEQDNRYGYAMFAADHSVKAAELLGLYWEDNDIEEKEAYLYKIYPAAVSSFTIDTGMVYIVSGEAAPVAKVNRVSAISGDRNVMLSWEKPIVPNVVSYNVERSEDGENFTVLNTTPIAALPRTPRDIEQYFQDTLLDNESDYYYRIVATDAFGDQGEYSDFVIGRGTPPAIDESPFFDAAKEVEEGKVMLQWVFPEKYNEQVEGFVIERSEFHEKGYEVIAEVPETDRTYYDEFATEKSYYRITAIAQDGRNRQSVETFVLLSDEEPPLAPTGLSGRIDKNGHLTLEWAENTENDLLGYRVFFGNAEDVEFARLTPYYLRENTFSDTVNMNVLNEDIYYKVVALDLRQNVSEFSEVIKVQKPDFIPPAPSRFLSFESTVEGIDLTWSASASDDVVSYSLRRRPFGENIWEDVCEYQHNGKEAFQYKDASTTEGQTYEYTVWAKDDAGLQSISAPIRLKAQTEYFKQAVSQFKASVDRREKHIQLTWKYINQDHLMGFMVYRSSKGNEPIEYQYIDKSEVINYKTRVRKNQQPFLFQDTGVSMNTDYTYRIKAIYGRGATSLLSPKLNVNY